MSFIRLRWTILLSMIWAIMPEARMQSAPEPERAQISLEGIVRSNGYYEIYLGDLSLGDEANCNGAAIPSPTKTDVIVNTINNLSIYTSQCANASDIKLISCNKIFIKPKYSINPIVEGISSYSRMSKKGFGEFGQQSAPEKIYRVATTAGSLTNFDKTNSFYEVWVHTEGERWPIRDASSYVITANGEICSDLMFDCRSLDETKSLVSMYYDCERPIWESAEVSIIINSKTQKTFDTFYTIAGTSGSVTETLSDEYKTDELISKATAALPAFDNDWDDSAVSYVNLASDELTYSIQKSRYRIRYQPPVNQEDAPKTLKWVERFIPENGVPITSIQVADGGSGYTSTPTISIDYPGVYGGTTAQAVATVVGGVITSVTLTNPGSGYNNPAASVSVSDDSGTGAVLLLHYGTETAKSAAITPASGPEDTSHLIGPFELAIPETNGSTVVANVHVPAAKWRRLDQAAEYQLRTKGGNWLIMAMPAGGSSGAGQSSANLGSIDFKLDLGPSPEGYSYGTLQLYADSITSAASRRAQWVLSTTFLSAAEVTPISDAGGLRQIISPAGLIDLQDASGGCDVRFYTASDYDPLNNGLYPVKAGAVPYATYEIRDATAASVAKLLIKELRPSVSGKYHLYGQQTGEVWSLEKGTLGAGSALVPETRTTRTPLTISSQPAYSFKEEDFSYDPGPRTTTRRTYTKDAAAPYTLKDQSIDYPEGRRVSYDYIQGYYDSYAGEFTAADWGSDLFTTETVGRALATPELWLGHSTRTTTVNNNDGRTLQRTLAVYNGSGFSEVEKTRYSYDGQGNLLSQTRNGQTIYSAQWTNGFKDWEIDETGIKTMYTPWPAGTYVTTSGKQPIKTQVKAAVDAYGDYPAQAAITTTYYYSPDGNGDVYISSEVKSGGVNSLYSTFAQDTDGRPTLTEANGLQTVYVYDVMPGGGLRTTITQASGATEIRVEDADGRILSVSGTGVSAEYHTYAKDVNGHEVHTTYYSSSNAATANYIAVTTDANGRRLREQRPAYLTATTAGTRQRDFYYNIAGQLVKETATGMADRLYVYNDLGDLWRSGLDMNGDGELTLASSDKLQQSETVYIKEGDDWYRSSTSQVPYTKDSATLSTVAQTKERLTLPAGTVRDSLTVDEAGVLTRTVSTVSLAQALGEERTTVSGVAGESVRVTRNGLLQSTQSNTQASPTRYAYDGLGRLQTLSPAGGPVTSYGYNSNGLLELTTRRSQDNTETWAESVAYYPQGEPGAGQISSRTTSGRTTFYSYNIRGQVLRQWGADYPVRFTYDTLGRMETLSTYRTVGFDFSASIWPAADITTWAYHPATGQLISKTDAASQPVIYTYWPSGAPKTRTWARGSVTTYGYTDAGEVSSITYSDSTPPVANTYDRGGRPLTTTDAAGLLTRSYESGVLLDEVYTGSGVLAGRSIDRGLGAYGRLSSLTTDAGYALGYTYDSFGRLDELTQGNHVAKYSYKANVGSVETVTIKRLGLDRVLNEYQEDGLGRLKRVKGTTGSTVPVERGYRYNAANQRDRITHEDGRLWAFGYDALGQVTSAQKRLADETTLLPGYSFGYGFDQIGNRKSTSVNGRSATYEPNQLNQIVSRQVPGVVDVRGEAVAEATVTTDAQATTRTGKDYYRAVSFNNAASAAKTRLNIAASDGTQTVTETRLAFLPKTPESFEYDLDGNLKQDGQWDYTWDAENRLIGMETRATVAAASGIVRQRFGFAYDVQGRRIRKRVELYNPSTSLWVQTADTQFVYDGWNLLAEHRWSPTTSVYKAVASYAWGLDLSGTSQGAGGVGGLLWANLDTQTFAASADANGNIVAYINTDTQAVAGRLDYAAFGEPVVRTGIAGLIPYGFSSKYTDAETGLVYYGYRYLNTSTGRWLSKDLIQERGGLNLYGLLDNKSVDDFDPLGLRGNNKPFPPKPHDEQLREKSVWVYGKHTVKITCVNGTADKIRQFAYERFKTFADFDSDFATVRVSDDGIARFDLLGIKGFLSDLAINEDRVPVYLYPDDPNTELKAKTAGGHQLVGIRKWRVEKISDQPRSVLLTTEAYERTRGLNRLGARMGRHDQVIIWRGYLERVAASVVAKFGGRAEKIEVIGPIDTEEIPNPFVF